jgi:PAS domain S-box-containing protein
MSKDRLSYQELQKQVEELKKENKTLRFQSLIQEGEGREYYFKSILNNIGDPVFVKDDQSRLVIVNDAFCNIFGLERETIIGKTLAEDVHEDERESFLKIDKEVIESGIENINDETLTVRGGHTRSISTRKTRFESSDGKKYLVGVIHDITERKRSEESLKVREKQLNELNASKDKLFSIIAHDLRSPYSNIIGLTELLIESINNSETEESKNYAQLLNSSAKNTLILLDNLLNWAKSQTGQLSFNPEKTAASDVIMEVIRINTSLATCKKISLKDTSTKIVEVYADRNMLKTILRNLISNAIKFTDVGGHIRVYTTLKSGNAEITVSDNGVGIDEEKQKDLFSLTPNKPSLGTAKELGSGLGLILCKEFVEKNGGKIWVESEKGKGSDFKFTVPLNRSK